MVINQKKTRQNNGKIINDLSRWDYFWDLFG
jgi:hypothetical protein